MDEIIKEPKPTEPPAQWGELMTQMLTGRKRKMDYALLNMSFDLSNIKWNNANKNCMAIIKNTIEPNILSSIGECDTVVEYLKKIKN